MSDGADLGDPLVTGVTTMQFLLTTVDGPAWTDASTLDDLPSALGDDAVGEEVTYVPEVVAAFATPAGDDPAADAVPWAGPSLPGEGLGDARTSCVVVRGEELSALPATVQQARPWTPWTTDGQAWRVALRPLLPDEDGCEDLAPEG